MNLVAYKEHLHSLRVHQQRLQQILLEKRTLRLAIPVPSFRLRERPDKKEEEFRVNAANQKLLNKIVEYSTISSPHVNLRQYFKAPRSKKLAEKFYQVNIQNRRMYDRLAHAKSAYPLSEMRKTAKKREGYLNSISRFGYRGKTPNKTQVPLFYQTFTSKASARKKTLLEQHLQNGLLVKIVKKRDRLQAQVEDDQQIHTFSFNGIEPRSEAQLRSLAQGFSRDDSGNVVISISG